MKTQLVSTKLLCGLIFVLSIFTIQLKSALCTSLASGNWSAGGTWSCGREPTCGDSVVIAAGHTVTTTSNENYTGCGSNIVLVIRGTMKFGNGDKFQFACNTRIYVFGGGQIVPSTGGGNSNNIQICGNTEWQAGDGTYAGPACLPPTLPSCPTVLPIELALFEARNCYKDKKCISWKTLSEKNNEYFEVLASYNGEEFRVIGREKSKAVKGNSSQPLDYEITYQTTDIGSIYFKLLQFDFDGSSSTSKVIYSNSENLNKDYEFSISPNPNIGQFDISINRALKGQFVEVKIYNSFGELIIARTMNITNSGRVDLPFTDVAFVSGVYFCYLSINGISSSKKIVVN